MFPLIPISANEKIYAVAKYIADTFEMSAQGNNVVLIANAIPLVAPSDVFSIVDKFASEHGIIEMVRDWTDLKDGERFFPVCTIRKTKGFDEYFAKLENAFEERASKSDNQRILWLSYDRQRRLVLNDLFLISQPQNGSQNDRLLRFLFSNQNKTITRKELENTRVLLKKGDPKANLEPVEMDEDKDFYIFLDDIKIKGDLRTLFFPKDLSNDTLHLKNPVLMRDLRAIGKTHLDWNTLFKPKKEPKSKKSD